ncbi:S8 family serine peptidase [Campylobacter sp. RM16188]|uniref:S8 family serine peptidase n=1 Tax=Campylobacter sp. RM16188 TaxID=1705725 RepID=UPI001557D661|nr:S8 family serine peptidase [Campylobacter sp. RM16188]
MRLEFSCAARTNKIALSIFACMFLASSANAYKEMGVLGNTSSWESDEYKKDWGLSSMDSSTAYAMGFNGGGVKIGVMDSGMLMSHPEFQDGRFSTIKSIGEYSKNGMRYPDTQYGNSPFKKGSSSDYDKSNKGEFKKGESFNIGGEWIAGINDSHGTHVGGTMAASRNGSGMHGVAFGSKLYSANTGGNDGMTYGPNQDYNFFLKGYTALADAGVRVINNSWGSNRKVNSAYPGATGWKIEYLRDSSGKYIRNPDGSVKFKIHKTNDPKDHMDLKDLDSAKKAYYQFVVSGEKSFVDAAYEVAVNRQIIQVFTAGNRDNMEESFTRSMLPYFRPDAEKYWINVTGQKENDGQRFNLAGHSKWWTIAAPGMNIYSSIVDIKTGKSDYASWGGTSMAAPHVSGALGVIFSRYTYMSADQVHDTMLTNTRQTQKNTSTPLEGWTSALGTPDARWGWGILDLGKSMFGPGQFLGKFDVSMEVDDIWSNNILDVAIKHRKTEDDNEAATWNARKALLNAKASLTAEEKAEMVFETAREKARAQRATEGYEGSLVKRGSGTLTLVGDNTFTGNTTIYGGKISALNQSLTKSNVVVENGGSLEILKERKYYVPSSTGWKEVTKTSTSDVVTATINNGGAFLLTRPGSANVNVTFKDGSLVGISENADELVELMKSPSLTRGYSAQGVFIGYEKTKFAKEYAFFNLTKEFANDKLKINVKKNSKQMGDFAASSNQKEVANFIEQSAILAPSNASVGFRSVARNNLKTSDLYRNLLFATPDQAKATFKTLANDGNFAAQNTSVLNSILLRNSISGHKANINAVNTNDTYSGLSFWTTTIAHNFKYNSVDAKSQTFGQIFGADGMASDNTRFGGVLGLSKTLTKIDGEKDYKVLNSNFGIYTQTDISDFKLNTMATYTMGKRHKESSSSIVEYVSNTKTKNKEAIAMVYADISHKGIESANFALSPYVGFGYINARVKTSEQQIGVYTMTTSKDNRDVTVATIGIKPSYAFGIFNANANIAYNRLFGQKAPSTTVGLGANGSIGLEGERLTDLTTIDAGLEAKIFKNGSVRLSYIGAFGDNVKSNGLNAKFSFMF